jgi:LmbE family N-acetylglucosaminyl deacetylase
VQDLIHWIIKEKHPCLFISPHLDDAILSAGGLIGYLAPKTSVTLATVFTQASDRPYTYFARGLLKSWGQSDAREAYRCRRREDRELCERISVRSLHLGYVDAAWRKTVPSGRLARSLSRFLPEMVHLYPGPLVIGRVSRRDGALRNRLRRELEQLARQGQIVFCPSALGLHVDHLITREAVLNVRTDAILWADFPYVMQSRPSARRVRLNGRLQHTWAEIAGKAEMIRSYKSQMEALFRGGLIPLLPETFYIPEAGL